MLDRASWYIRAATFIATNPPTSFYGNFQKGEESQSLGEDESQLLLFLPKGVGFDHIWSIVFDLNLGFHTTILLQDVVHEQH